MRAARFRREVPQRAPSRRRWRSPVLIAVLLAFGFVGSAVLCRHQPPKHGGILEFAVVGRARQLRLLRQHVLRLFASDRAALLDPAQIRCGQLSKDRRRLGAIVERVARPADLHLQAAAQYPVPRRIAADLGRRQGELSSASSTRRRASVSARQVDYAAISSIDTPDAAHRRLSLWSGRMRRCWRISHRRGTASTAPPSSPRIPQFPKTHILGSGAFTFVEHVKGQVLARQTLRQIFSARQTLSRRLTRPIS